MTVRDTARTAMERHYVEVLEIDLDRCTNTYGVAPCTATGAAGTECYNTFQTCQAKAAYNKGIHTYSFITRGAPIPPGELVRPYLDSSNTSPTVANPGDGLARRASVSVKLVDEPDSDTEQDPYKATRAPAQGTFWTRLIARNRNYGGRAARLRRGFAVTPWDWGTFQTERYIIDSLAGPDKNGVVSMTLKDPITLADQVKVPIPTDGKVAVALPDYERRGYAQSGTLSTIVLDTKASAVDGYYVGMAVRIDDQTAAGEERIISAYVGATREATVSVNWSVAPDSTSLFSIHHLQVSVTAGKGAQYDVYGYPAYVRLGDEIIRITSRSGDTLLWDTSADRAQFNTPLASHNTSETLQACKTFSDTPITDVVIALANEAGISNTYIDTVGLADQETTWYGTDYHITVALSAPDTVSNYLKELAIESSSIIWWSPIDQKLKMMAVVPNAPSTVPLLSEEASIIEGSFDVQRLDDQRLTMTAMAYNLIYPTADRKKPSSFLSAEMFIDADAESANEYGDQRVNVIYSRWFGAANAQAAANLAGRTINARRNAPLGLKFKIDPKDANFDVGALRDVLSNKITDVTGAPVTMRVLITRYDDNGRFVNIEARSTDFGRRWAFIAPDGTPDYPADSSYAHICLDTGLMGDGTEGYLII